MKNFIILWSLMSPICITPILYVLLATESSWYPTSNIGISIIVYLAYWIPLGILQGLLLFKFQYKKIAYEWFVVTSITGFLIMFCHDLSALILGADTRGQGVLYLLMSLPFLAGLGGLILGFAQFWVLQSYRNKYLVNKTPREPRLRLIWFASSFFSWLLGFVGLGIATLGVGGHTPFIFIPFFAMGAALKGYVVMRYLQR